MPNAYFILTVLAVSLGIARTEQPLAFEVASVHLHQGPVQRNGPLAVTGPLIRIQGYTLFGLILDA